MSLSQTENTKINLTAPSDEISMVILPYGKKLQVSTDFDVEKDRTQQEFKDECDINGIMARYMKTGMIDFVNRHEPQYEDTTGYEFQSAMEIVANAQSMFEELPAKMRDRFANDPAEFLNFVSDKENAREAAEMGLLDPEKAAAILSPPPASQTAPEPVKQADLSAPPAA